VIVWTRTDHQRPQAFPRAGQIGQLEAPPVPMGASAAR
jgi:hypothetical protein